MGLRTSLDTLNSRLRALGDTVNDLRLTAIEDRPADHIVLDTVAGAVDEMAGWVFEARAEAGAASEALARGDDTGTAVARLAACQERVNRLCGGAWISYETYAHLGRLAREYGGEWSGWLAMLRLGLESCGPPLNAVQAALLESWREAVPAAAGTRSADDTSPRPALADVNSQWRCFP